MNCSLVFWRGLTDPARSSSKARGGGGASDGDNGCQGISSGRGKAEGLRDDRLGELVRGPRFEDQSWEHRPFYRHARQGTEGRYLQGHRPSLEYRHPDSNGEGDTPGVRETKESRNRSPTPGRDVSPRIASSIPPPSDLQRSPCRRATSKSSPGTRTPAWLNGSAII